MRIAHLILAATLGCAPLAYGQAAPAAPAPAAPQTCTGNINIVRISEIKPGMMPKFLEAVAAQQAWYKSAGTPDQISVMRVMERDATTGVSSFSETTALTTHILPASGTRGPAHDAGYSAFVAMFRESSTIKTEYLTCMAP